MGPPGLVCGNEESGPWGLPLKARSPLGMTALVRGTDDSGSEDGEEETVFNYLNCVGMN